MLPVKSVMACASRSSRVALFSSCRRRSFSAWILRAKTGASPSGCGDCTVGPARERAPFAFWDSDSAKAAPGDTIAAVSGATAHSKQSSRNAVRQLGAVGAAFVEGAGLTAARFAVAFPSRRRLVRQASFFAALRQPDPALGHAQQQS